MTLLETVHRYAGASSIDEVVSAKGDQRIATCIDPLVWNRSEHQ